MNIKISSCISAGAVEFRIHVMNCLFHLFNFNNNNNNNFPQLKHFIEHLIRNIESNSTFLQ